MHLSIALLLALTTAPLSPTQNATIRKIEGRIMAPCCYTQTILEHQSQVAEDMREEVTAMVASGKNEPEIIEYYRTKYGETILVVPDGWSGRLLTFTPVLIFFASAGLVLFLIRRSIPARVTVEATQVGHYVVEAPRFRDTIRRETSGDF